MAHLTDEQIVDALDGHATYAAHLSACGACAAKIDALRETLGTVASIEAPEPSPLFWTSLAARINDAIDAPPPRHPWWAAPGLAWLGVAAAVVLAAALMVVQLDRDHAVPQVADNGPAPALPTLSAADAATDLLGAQPWPDDDEAWNLVRAFAMELEYDDVRGAGIAPRPGAIERAALELGDDERAELVRLIEDELKRRGV
jgi:hypothetical protein